LLLVEDDDVQRQCIVELIGERSDVNITAISTGEQTLAALKSGRFDCVVLDLGLPDMTGFELIERIKTEVGVPESPMILYTARELTEHEEMELLKVVRAIIVKGVHSPECLLDETVSLLEGTEENSAETTRQMLAQQPDPLLAGKKVLIVDDDSRNIVALASIMERHEMRVMHAENGKDGIGILEKTPDIDIVLMDVMMPEMDGYEAMQAIRHIDSFKCLPIIALTAKAMKGDCEKCIEAGASDYITKPADAEHLLSRLRLWLQK
jgi:CheY-like chemotaxis protein